MTRLLRPRPRTLARRLLTVAAVLLWPACGLLPAAPLKAGKSKKSFREALATAVGPIVANGSELVYTESDCVGIAVRQNPDVLAALKRVDASAGAVTASKGPLYPALTTTGFYQRLEQSVANGGQETLTVNSKGVAVLTTSNFVRPSDYYGDVRVAQNLYSGGGVRNRIAAAKLREKAAGFDYQTQLDVTTLAVRAAFYATLFAEANIGIRQQAVDLLGAQVKDQQDRLAAGSVGQINVNRSQVQLANERPALLDAQATLNTSYATLAQLLGVSYAPGSLKAPFRVQGTLEYRPMPLTVGECVERAEAKRPEVQSRLLAIDALKRQVAAEKSATRPQVAAFASYDLYSEPDIRTVDDYYSGYTLGVVVNWTIFDGFATRGRVRGAQAQVGAAEAQLASVRHQVETDVYSAYADLRAAESSLRPLSDNIRLATETLGLTSRNFDAGLTTQLDVLQARVDLTRSRLGELAGRLTYDTALARLERAMALGRPVEGSATALTAQTAK